MFLTVRRFLFNTGTDFMNCFGAIDSNDGPARTLAKCAFVVNL